MMAPYEQSLAALLELCQCAVNTCPADVSTTRIATNSFEEWCDVSDSAATLEAFRTLDSLLVELGVGLFNAGPATSAAALSLVPKIVQLGGRINCTGALTDPLDANGALALAATILEISQSTDGGTRRTDASPGVCRCCCMLKDQRSSPVR